MIATIIDKEEPVTIFIPCPECGGEGQREYEKRTMRFFDPFTHSIETCQKCGGAGEVEVEATSDEQSTEKS